MGIDLPPDEMEKLGLGAKAGKPKPNHFSKATKFKNKPTTVMDGNSEYRCDSKSEAARISALVALRESGEIADFVFHPRVRLDVHTYAADALVVDASEGYAREVTGRLPGGPYRSWYEDPKGVETQRFRDTRKSWKAHGRLPLRVIKGKKDDWVIPDRLLDDE